MEPTASPPVGEAQPASTVAAPTLALPARRLKSATDAALELHQHWNAWTTGLGKFALQTAFGLMAANWAVHGSNPNGILANAWAKSSMTLGFVYLTLLLLLIGRHVLLLGKRRDYADEDRARWQAEYDAESSNVGTPWPYTAAIERNGALMHVLHFVVPLVMGVLLIISVFSGNPPTATPVVGKTPEPPTNSTPAKTTPVGGNAVIR